MRLYQATASGANHHGIQRTFLLAWIIDRTKSIQRGRIPTIQIRPEEPIRRALEWSEEEPDTLFVVMYSELLNVTSKTLEQLSAAKEEPSLLDFSTRVFVDFSQRWLGRFEERSQ